MVTLRRSDWDEIDELITRFADGFKRLDADLLASIWADNDIFYSPAELVDPICTKAELNAYYLNIAEMFRDVTVMEVFGIHRNGLTDECVAAYFRFRFQAEIRAGSRGHHVEGRVTAIFRRLDGVWRGVHYHESLAPSA